MARDDKSIPHRSSCHIPISFSSRLPSRPSSRHCFSSLLIVVPIRAPIVSVYHPSPPVHFIGSSIPISLPFTVALILRRSYSYHHRHFIPRPDGENELNKTARSSVSSNGTPISATAIAKSNSTTGGNRNESTPPRDEKDEPPPSQQS